MSTKSTLVGANINKYFWIIFLMLDHFQWSLLLIIVVHSYYYLAIFNTILSRCPLGLGSSQVIFSSHLRIPHFTVLYADLRKVGFAEKIEEMAGFELWTSWLLWEHSTSRPRQPRNKLLFCFFLLIIIHTVKLLTTCHLWRNKLLFLNILI